MEGINVVVGLVSNVTEVVLVDNTEKYIKIVYNLPQFIRLKCQKVIFMVIFFKDFFSLIISNFVR